jgi:hypothetical protein
MCQRKMPDRCRPTTIPISRQRISYTPARWVSVSPRGDVHDAVVAAIKAGDFYDAAGRLRKPSREEVAELHRVTGQLRRGEHVPGLA